MPSKVKLYALSTCIHCRKAKDYLDKCSVDYDCTYVDRLAGQERQDTVDAVKKLNPSLSFPTITIGDRVLVGYNEADLKDVLEMEGLV